jgi:hypothetical protein
MGIGWGFQEVPTLTSRVDFDCYTRVSMPYLGFPCDGNLSKPLVSFLSRMERKEE